MVFTRSNEHDLPPKKGQEGFSLRFSILVYAPVCLSKSVKFRAHLKLLQSGELSKRGILCIRHFLS